MSTLLNLKPYIKNEPKKLDPLLHFNVKDHNPEVVPVLKILNNTLNIELTDLYLKIGNKEFPTKDFNTLGDFFTTLLGNSVNVKVINNPSILHLPFLSVVNFNTYSVNSLQGLKSPTPIEYFEDLHKDILNADTEYLVINTLTAEPIESELVNNNIYFIPNFYSAVIRRVTAVDMYINVSLNLLKHTERVY